jgi:hypothetical protein
MDRARMRLTFAVNPIGLCRSSDVVGCACELSKRPSERRYFLWPRLWRLQTACVTQGAGTAVTSMFQLREAARCEKRSRK